jgi:hypothetical protein
MSLEFLTTRSKTIFFYGLRGEAAQAIEKVDLSTLPEAKQVASRGRATCTT